VWTYEHSLETRADPAAVYELMSDVTTWPDWNPGVESVDLDGPFTAGTSGTMAMPGQPPLDFRLVWVEEHRGFEDHTVVEDAGVTVRVRHSLEPLAGGGTRITYRCTINGPRADSAGPEVGAAVTADFPDVMAALAARAEVARPDGWPAP
jgi:hypothetical protein